MIYLASASARRKKILKDHDIRFKVVRHSVIENADETGSPSRLVMQNAFLKASSAARRVRNGVVLGADSVVYFDKRIIGKPKTRREAFGMLSRLQGRWQRVYTGVALLKIRSGKVAKKEVFFETTRVRLKPMSRRQIRDYFKRMNPLDKAGGAAIQSNRAGLASEIKGSFTNVVGLPVEKLCARLKKLWKKKY